MAHDNATLRARPTSYKGVRMRSRLEAGFAQWLDAARLRWEYEPECFASESGQYLPDFRVQLPILLGGAVDTFPAYVEVKPRLSGLAFVQSIFTRMSVICDSDPEAHLLIVSPDFDGVLTADRTFSDTGWIGELQWIEAFSTSKESVPRVVLGTQINSHRRPWAGEWWKGGDA